MHIILTEDPIPVIDRNTSISIKLTLGIDKAVRKNAGERYQTADEFRKDLLAYV